MSVEGQEERLEQQGPGNPGLNDVAAQAGEVRGGVLETMFSNPDAKRELTQEQKEQLLITLETRFGANMRRHFGVEWAAVEAKLNANPGKLLALYKMEITGGEPDVVGFIEETGHFKFFDCSKESPIGRRKTCFNLEGQKEAEKEGKHPAGNVEDLVKAMGVGGILSERQIRRLYELDVFDMDSWSWVKLPDDLGELKDVGLEAKCWVHPNGKMRVSTDLSRSSTCCFNKGFRCWIII